MRRARNNGGRIQPIRLRSWRVVLIRNRGEYLGDVEASSLEAAEMAALQVFNLKHEDRKRLLLRERGLLPRHTLK
jgi:hypothetical protein